MGFETEYLEEADLQFAGGESKDPRVGLIKFGPRTPESKNDHKVAKIGIVGSAESIAGVEELLHQMKTEIPPDTSQQRWNPPFPGLGEDSPLNLTLEVQKRWREKIESDEIEEVEESGSVNKKVEKAISIFEDKIQLIYEKESPPDVIIVAIPPRIYEACTSSKKGAAKIQSDDIDFHNRIKLIGMEHKLPTQLIKPKTLRREETQSLANIAWNFAVGLMYKARRGHPWKLTELEQGTCFVGISFYREMGEKERARTSMAQVFLETGESFILRGDPLEDEKLGKSPGNYHLTENDAKKLINKVLDQYKSIKGHYPNRLVIHKTSKFWEEEKEGFIEASSELKERDFITIHEHTDVRAFSSKKHDYPVLRGTVAKHDSGQEFYLFTKGFIPSIQTFPGHRVPKPIRIRPDEEVNDSNYRKICKEILSFTKLDWNTSHFCRKMPVTTVVSDSVGDILADSSAKNVKVDPHYYYYM
ncbi:MAG: hypothetical protein ABEJ83_00420 [Candidatus Nanohaloarchaea archaeon]